MKRIRATHVLAGLALFLGLAGTAASQTPSQISVRLVDTLNTESAQAGDTFSATLAEPLIVSGRVVAQKDARVTGRVREAVSSGRLKRPALITLHLDRVEARGRSYPIATGDLTIKQSSHTTRNLVIIGGSAGAGAAIGAAAGGGKGAALGTAIGAGAGTLTAFLTGKREIALPAETLLTFRVNSVTVSPDELQRLQRADQATGNEPYDARNSRPAVRDRRHEREDEDADDDARDRGRDSYRNSDIIFLPDERVLIYDFFRGYRSNLPPGLAKRDRLPPGLEKQLRERGTLPPGLQKRMQPLPYDLERRLRRLPYGYRRVIVGGNVILMEARTAVIYDIIRDVIR